MLKGLSILMLITILAIAGFQGYWLRENYKKEDKNLKFQTNVAFHETVRKLQAKKLKLDKFFNDSTDNIRIEVAEGRPFPARPSMMGDEVAGYLNDVTIRINDSLSKLETTPGQRKTIAGFITEKAKQAKDTLQVHSKANPGMVISMSNADMMFRSDSSKEYKFEKRIGRPGEIFRFLYGVDSLQDSLKIHEIDSACKEALKKEGISVSYSISRSDSFPSMERMMPEDRGPVNKITIGFAHPVTYELSLGNSFGYLMKKLSSPILFSLFLVGVTILSFVLLYRNLVRQKKLTEIKNEFISNITHELKTPIATVGVAIEALRNFNAIKDPQRTKEYLDISQNELQRLSLLVDKVLKLSMFEKKEIELRYETVNLKDIVNEVVSSMKLQSEKNNATVTVSQEGNTSLQGDRLHLLSVVFNLLDNALKYGNGNTTIKIEIKEKARLNPARMTRSDGDKVGQGNDVELSIADNGIGISPEYKDRVFEKFFRIPAGDTHNTKGYGLGLSYVAHVVGKHKGRIAVESQLGLGSKFIITLPTQQA